MFTIKYHYDAANLSFLQLSDGDLGSSMWIFYVSFKTTINPILPIDEILLSSDKTVAVIDGSGVLADPIGIDRAELIRLAKLRVPVAHFDTAKLSKDGYLVKVEDQDVKLPCTLFFLSFSFNPFWLFQ